MLGLNRKLTFDDILLINQKVAHDTGYFLELKRNSKQTEDKEILENLQPGKIAKSTRTVWYFETDLTKTCIKVPAQNSQEKKQDFQKLISKLNKEKDVEIKKDLILNFL